MVVHYVVRRAAATGWRHLVVPVVGFAILGYVVINAKVAAQRLGFVWLGIGVVAARRSCWPPAASRARRREESLVTELEVV